MASFAIQDEDLDLDDIELVRADSDDELEEFFSQSVLDCRKDFKFNQIENECRRKFILH